MRILIEAVRFWFAITPRWRLWPRWSYLQWRLGTVYGSFYYYPLVLREIPLKYDLNYGQLRPVRELLGDAWRDRDNVIGFLRWRRGMRK